MLNAADLVAVSGWGVPFSESFISTNPRVTCRVILIANTRSMSKLDGVRMVRDKGNSR